MYKVDKYRARAVKYNKSITEGEVSIKTLIHGGGNAPLVPRACWCTEPSASRYHLVKVLRLAPSHWSSTPSPTS